MRRGVVFVAAASCGIAIAILVVTRTSPEAATTRAPIAADPQPIVASATIAATTRGPVSDERPAATIPPDAPDAPAFETFERLRRSRRGTDLRTAQSIVRDCRLTLRDESAIGRIVAGQPFNHFEKIGPGTRAGGDVAVGSLAVTEVAATPAQLAAARELRRRCAGFESMTSPAYRAAIADLDGRLWHADDAAGLMAAIASGRLPATPDRLRTILASRDPVALTSIDDELAERWQRRGGVPLVHGMFGAPTPVMQLVGCDLDADCGPTSRTALLGCIDDAQGCGLDVHHQLMRVETPAAQQSIEDIRARYLDAIVRGDYTVWGL